jgi:nitroreductase
MIENMMLEASSIGLGSCWIHRLKQEMEMDEGKRILKSLNLNLDEYEGIGHVILGYPMDNLFVKKEIKENRVFHID